MSEKQKKPEKPEKKRGRSVLYCIARPIFTFLFSTILPVKYHHREGLPAQPPYVVISNHISLMDPLIVGVGVRKYQIRFIGKKELWKNRLFAAVLNAMRMIPVDRHHTDMEAMRACMRVTREGNILGIFPEGTRYHKGVMEELESGVGLIALRSRVPLIPVYISGKVRLFRRLDVYVGDPIPCDDLLEMGVNRESCELLLKRITETYAGLQAAHTKA